MCSVWLSRFITLVSFKHPTCHESWGTCTTGTRKHGIRRQASSYDREGAHPAPSVPPFGE